MASSRSRSRIRTSSPRYSRIVPCTLARRNPHRRARGVNRGRPTRRGRDLRMTRGGREEGGQAGAGSVRPARVDLLVARLVGASSFAQRWRPGVYWLLFLSIPFIYCKRRGRFRSEREAALFSDRFTTKVGQLTVVAPPPFHQGSAPVSSGWRIRRPPPFHQESAPVASWKTRGRRAISSRSCTSFDEDVAPGYANLSVRGGRGAPPLECAELDRADGWHEVDWQ